jgi:serine 3-dehydrogenase
MSADSPATSAATWAESSAVLERTTASRTALITGATSGIGRACAERFARAGWQVVALGRRADRLAELARELGERVLAVPVDLRDLTAVRSAVDELPVRFRGIDLLINNAGTAARGPLQDSGADPVHAVVETNIAALVELTRLLLPTLIERVGAVINVGSTAARYPHGGSIVYGASKAFVAHFSTGLRSDLHGTGVRVTVVEPGRVDTEILSEVEYRTLDATDVADAMLSVAHLPPHVNVNRIELMPTSQSPAGYRFHPARADMG